MQAEEFIVGPSLSIEIHTFHNSLVGYCESQTNGANRELQSWIDNVIVPILVQRISEEPRQRSATQRAGKVRAQDGVANVRPVLFGLSVIEPNCVPSLRQQLAWQMFPIDTARLGVGSVVDVRARHKSCITSW